MRVDLEGLGDAVDGNVDGVFVVGGEGPVRGRRGEEIADCEREALLGGERRGLGCVNGMFWEIGKGGKTYHC